MSNLPSVFKQRKTSESTMLSVYVGTTTRNFEPLNDFHRFDKKITLLEAGPNVAIFSFPHLVILT